MVTEHLFEIESYRTRGAHYSALPGRISSLVHEMHGENWALMDRT